MKIQNKNKYIPASNFFKRGNLMRGYSIVEIIVYLAIFTAISILVINSFIVILSSFNTTNMNRKMLEAGTVTMERMSREIRQAKNVDIVNSFLNINPGVLQLNSTDSGGNSITIKFKSENNGELNLYKNNNLEGNLLGNNLSVTNLIFSRITTTESEAVRVRMTLQYSEGNNTKSENFYDTIVLRGGY